MMKRLWLGWVLVGIVGQIAIAHNVRFAGIPALNYTSDEGFGLGAVVSLHELSSQIKPYVWSADAQVFVSTKGTQSHYLKLDWVDAFSLPLRLRSKIGLLATVSQNYCGQGQNANCDVDAAKQYVESLNLPSQEEAEALRTYYLYRYLEPYAILEARWLLSEAWGRLFAVTSYRASYYQAGSFSEAQVYPYSLYSQYAPLGESGLASVLELGLMLDKRDNELAPTSGVLFEASLRESARVWGSNWSYLGGNLAARAFLPIIDQRLVLAGYGSLDIVIGNVPIQEMVRLGGTLRHNAFGGSEVGRGIREQYFPGRIKAIQELELRLLTTKFDFVGQHFDLYTLAFADLGLVASSLESLATEPNKALVGFGGGVRLAWNEAFIIRLDTGVSPIENYAPRLYFKIGNVF